MNQIDIYNTPVSPINDVNYTAGWFSDTWKLTSRLTINYGGRLEDYKDGWPDQTVAPNGLPVLANWPETLNPVERARYFSFIAPKTVTATVVSKSTTFAPRIGFAYDLLGNNRTVLKAFFGQFRYNSADTLADAQNPVARAQLRYAFNDLTATASWTDRRNCGTFNSTQGGGGFVTVDPNLMRPTSNEVSTSLEHEIRQGLSGRVSYVYKNIRNEWSDIDVARRPLYTVPFNFIDVGTDGIAGTVGRQDAQLLDRPATAPTSRVFTNPEGLDHADFNTVEVALNRRFAGKWMLLTSFGYTLAESDPRHDLVDRHDRRRRQPAVEQPRLLSSVAADVRRRRLRDLDHLELQGDRPLHDAVGHRLVRVRGRCRAAISGAASPA